MTPQDAGPHTTGPHTTAPQDTVERALAAARSDDCIVIADESSTANLRWAGNTLTTNGVSRSRQLTVIAVSRRAAGPTWAWCRGRACATTRWRTWSGKPSRPPPTAPR